MPDDLTSQIQGASFDLAAQQAQQAPPAEGELADQRYMRRQFLITTGRGKSGSSKEPKFLRPMPKFASEMDDRSKTSSPLYRPLSVRIDDMADKGWLASTDGWLKAADRKSSILKGSSRLRLQGKMAEETDILNSYWGWRGIMQSEYDLLESYTLLDVESLYKQAITRMTSLAFRSGVHVVGENETYVNYVNDRIGQIGYVMQKGFTQWLKEVIWNLWLCSNCIVSKIRDTDLSGGDKSERNDNRTPVAGYYIIPPQTIFPYLDGRGHIEKWRRFYKDGRPYRDYLPEDIIHFKWDVKPGHIFGTPRMASVRDDIFALRRLEENVELLLIHHLFPLFHVKVGSKEDPVEYLPDGSSEIDYVRAQIMNMPKEGVFVTDNRVEVKVEGADGKGIEPAPVLEHYFTRVLIGMGVSGVDLGIADTANRSTADSVSQNLKEMVKSDLQTFSDMVHMQVFRELFQESRVKLDVQKAVATTTLDFGEIDVDGQIKQETHALNTFMSHGIDHDELRKRLRKNPLRQEQVKKTHFQMHMVGMEKEKHKLEMQTLEAQHEQEGKLQTQSEKHQAKMSERSEEGKLKAVAVTAASTKKTKVTKKSANGSSHTKETHEPTSHAKKALSNVVQPANQHGKNLDPHKARSSEDPSLSQTVYDDLAEMWAQHADAGEWKLAAEAYVDTLGLEEADAGTLKRVLATVEDQDLLWASVKAFFSVAEPEEDEETGEDEVDPELLPTVC